MVFKSQSVSQGIRYGGDLPGLEGHFPPEKTVVVRQSGEKGALTSPNRIRTGADFFKNLGGIPVKTSLVIVPNTMAIFSPHRGSFRAEPPLWVGVLREWSLESRVVRLTKRCLPTMR